MAMEFLQDLKRMGLTDKEAAVYLAALQLGPSPVQNIARKAKVVRATTYVILDDLQRMGLVTHFKEGKKTLFSAEPPRQLYRLLEKQEEAIHEKKRELDQILPELQVLIKGATSRPTVRYFEGKEGLRAMRQEIIMYGEPGDMMYNFSPLDHIDAVFPETDSTWYLQRAARGIRAKTIFTTRSTKLREVVFAESKRDKVERRFIPPEKFPSSAGISVYRDRIAIGSFSGKLAGIVVESQPFADTIRYLFELAWPTAATFEQLNKKK